MGRYIFLFGWIAGLMLITLASHAASYQVTGPTTPYTWIDISGTGTNVTLADDSVSAAIAIGFTFNFGGTNYTQLRIGSNGWIFFGATSTAYTNTTVASSPVTNVLMPYWDDLNPASVAGRIRYQMLGSAPNRQFVVSYLAVPTYGVSGGATNTFQLVLNENGSFLYNYQTTRVQGASATIGYNFSASDLVQFSFNTVSVPNARTLTWTPYPALTHLKTVAVISDPVNGAVSPYYIPGATVEYTLLVTNSGVGSSQNDTLSIVDPIPANLEFFSGNLSGGAPYLFTGSVAPASGVTCPFVALNNFTDCIDFSSDGGTTWTYVPNGGFDPAVTHIRFRPSGRINGDAPLGAPSPSFSLQFRGRIE